MQPQKELSISATAAHTTAGVTRTYGGMSNSDSARTASGARHTAAGEQVHNRPKHTTSPAGITSEEGPLNTPQIENEAADAPNDAAEHATRLNALLSELPNLEVAGQCPPDEDSEKGDALSDTEHSTNPASPTTPPYEYGDTDEENEFVVGNGMQMF